MALGDVNPQTIPIVHSALKIGKIKNKDKPTLLHVRVFLGSRKVSKPIYGNLGGFKLQ